MTQIIIAQDRKVDYQEGDLSVKLNVPSHLKEGKFPPFLYIANLVAFKAIYSIQDVAPHP